MSMGSVTIVNMSEENAGVAHSIKIVRTDRVGLFPGFCADNFPYAVSQIGDFSGDQFLK